MGIYQRTSKIVRSSTIWCSYCYGLQQEHGARS
jgi:hypothetical protein